MFASVNSQEMKAAIDQAGREIMGKRGEVLSFPDSFSYVRKQMELCEEAEKQLPKKLGEVWKNLREEDMDAALVMMEDFRRTACLVAEMFVKLAAEANRSVR